MFTTTTSFALYLRKNRRELINLDLTNCKLCPHLCGVNRFVETGYCKTPAHPLVSSVCIHKGEEPVLSGTKGVCNVFFAHCNLHCIFCQNHQISRNNIYNHSWIESIDDLVNAIIPYLNSGIRMLGFVSPSHQSAQMVEVVEILNAKGYRPTVIYNTNCYDNVDTLRKLEGIVDIYLPDFKYLSNSLGERCSNVSNYSNVAVPALREMLRQKGSSLLIGDDGLLDSGLIVRHLVLPGYVQESIDLLRFLFEEFTPRLYISLMSQYYPPSGLILDKPLCRSLNEDEYKLVVDLIEELGFRGWVQAIESQNCYRPDFFNDQPFL